MSACSPECELNNHSNMNGQFKKFIVADEANEVKPVGDMESAYENLNRHERRRIDALMRQGHSFESLTERYNKNA